MYANKFQSSIPYTTLWPPQTSNKSRVQPLKQLLESKLCLIQLHLIQLHVGCLNCNTSHGVFILNDEKQN